MLEYQRPDTTVTLSSGLEEYYASHADLVDGRSVSPRAREFFRCHDAAHVVFGCSTTLLNEAIVKTWSFFGTTRGLNLVREYRLPESQEIYERLRWGAIVGTAFRSVLVLPRVMVRCSRMRERWPWAEFDVYQSLRLDQLRERFGIDVLVAE